MFRESADQRRILLYRPSRRITFPRAPVFWWVAIGQNSLFSAYSINGYNKTLKKT